MNARGYVLPSVLAVIALLSSLFYLLQLNFGSNMAYNVIDQRQQALRWAAESALTELYHAFKSDYNALQKMKDIDYEGIPVTLRRQQLFRGRPVLQLLATAGGSDDTALAKSRAVAAVQYYSDYMLAAGGDLFIEPLSQKERFYLGPVFANGNIFINGGGMHFYTTPAIARDSYSISSGREIFVKNESDLFQPVNAGTGYFNRDPEYPLQTIISKMSLKAAVADDDNQLAARRRMNIEALSDYGFNEVFNSARELVDDNYLLSRGNSHIYKKERIINPVLIEKDLVGLGNGSQRTFAFKPRALKPERVYVRDISATLETNYKLYRSYRVDPVIDRPAPPPSDYRLGSKSVTFSKEEEWVKLKLPGDAFDRRGSVSFRNEFFSALIPGRDILELRFGLGANAYTLESKDYEVNFKTGRIVIYDASLVDAIWPEIGYTDGSSRVFDYSTGGGQAVMVDGQVVPADIGLGQVYLKKTWPAGLPLHILMGKPSVTVRLRPPGFNHGIFLDRQLEVIVLDLDSLVPFPQYGLILSKVPLLVVGNAVRPVTIICREDVYLGSVNAGLKNPRAVAVISGGMVWAMKTKKLFKGQQGTDTIDIRGVMALSRSDDFIVMSDEKDWLAEVIKPPTHFFEGSLFLAGRRRNLYSYRKDNPAGSFGLGEFYYYYNGLGGAFHFYYPSWFRNRANLPYKVPVSLRLLEWTRQVERRRE